MKTFVIDVNTKGACFVEPDIDKVVSGMGFEKVRVAEPYMYGLLKNPFPNHIQWTKKMGWLESMFLSYKIGKALKYNLYYKNVKVGWAEE